MNRVLSLLGLAQKAGAVKSGMYLTEEAVKTGRAKLVIVTADAKNNTAGTLQDKCASYGVPLRILSDRETLGHAIGKEMRTCVAVTNAGFAKKILELTDSTGEAQG